MSWEFTRWAGDLRREDVGKAEGAILGVLAAVADETGRVDRLCHETIADRSRIGRSTAYGATKSLEERGILKITRPPGRPGGRSQINIYHIQRDAIPRIVPSFTMGSGRPRISGDRVYSDRECALTRRAAEAAGMIVDPSPGDFATGARWAEALDRAEAPDELVIEIIRKDRSRPDRKVVSYLNYYTKSIMRELERRTPARVAEGATTAAPTAAVVSAAPPPASATAKPGPSVARGLAIQALAWANIARQPYHKEIEMALGWMQLGATAELMQAVIEGTLARATARATKPPPATLYYFDHEIREALGARSPHGLPRMPAASAPIPPDRKPSPEGDPAARPELPEPVEVAAKAITTAAPVTSTVVSAAALPASETTGPEPSVANGLAIEALAWANIAGRPPNPKEIGMVWGWEQRGATVELIRRVIVRTLARATKSKSQPATLHYFDQAMHGALDARSRRGSPPKPAASAPMPLDRKPSPEGEQEARIIEGAPPPPPPADDFLTAARAVNDPAATSLNGPEPGPRNRPDSGPESSVKESTESHREAATRRAAPAAARPAALAAGKSSAVVLVAARARGRADRPLAEPAAIDANLLMDRSGGTVPAAPAFERTSGVAPAKVRVDLTTELGLLAAYKSGYFGPDRREATGKMLEEALKHGLLTPAVDLTTDLGLFAAYKSGHFGPDGHKATGKMLEEALKRGFVTFAAVTRWNAARRQEVIASRAKVPAQTLIA
jgi:hypothetical protein